MPGYEKTNRYFRRVKLYEYLRTHGDIGKAMKFGEKLSALSSSSPEDQIAYSQIHRLLLLLSEMSAPVEKGYHSKSDFSERIGEMGFKIIDFLTNFPDSDAKSISKAVGLRPSRISDYLKKLLDEGIIETTESWPKTYHLKP